MYPNLLLSSVLGGVKVGDGLNIANEVLGIELGNGLEYAFLGIQNAWLLSNVFKSQSLVGCAKNTQQASYAWIRDTKAGTGLKVMWGHYRADKNNYTITFPTAFTSAWSYSIISTNDDYNYNSTASKRAIQERTATSCKIWSEKYEGLWVAVGY